MGSLLRLVLVARDVDGGQVRARGRALRLALAVVLVLHLERDAEALLDLLRAAGLAPAPVDEDACDDACDLRVRAAKGSDR